MRPLSSGGVLMLEQSAYDLRHYDVAVKVNIPNQSNSGVLTATAKLLKLLPKGKRRLPLPADKKYEIDPNGWMLKKP